MGKARRGWRFAELAVLRAVFLPLLQVDTAHFYWQIVLGTPKAYLQPL